MSSLWVQEDTTAATVETVARVRNRFCAGQSSRSTMNDWKCAGCLPKNYVSHCRRDIRSRASAMVRPADLEGQQLLVMEGHCLGQQVLNFCDRRDLHPTISFRSAQLETIQSLNTAQAWGWH